MPWWQCVRSCSPRCVACLGFAVAGVVCRRPMQGGGSMKGFRIALAGAMLFACGIAAAQTAVAPVLPVLKKSIAVDGFDNRSSGNGAGDVQIAERLADQLVDALMHAGTFVVLEIGRASCRERVCQYG